MHRRVLPVLVVAVTLASAGLTGTAGAEPEASASGYTNACFGPSCVAPNSESMQVAQWFGLAYFNATFAGTTADGAFALGGDPEPPNRDNLGSFTLFAYPTSYDGVTFRLRVRAGTSTISLDAALHGTDASGVLVDFDNRPQPIQFSDSSTGALAVQDVAVAPGATVALSGVITTTTTTSPSAAPLAPSAAAPPVTVAGSSDRGGAWSGSTAGGVLAFSAGAVTLPADPASYTGQSFGVTLALTAPVAHVVALTAAVTGTVVMAGTGGVVLDFPDPVPVAWAGGRLLIGLNDVAVAPGHSADLTGMAMLPPPNLPPVAVADAFGRKNGNHVATGNVLANDSDPEGDPLTAQLVGAPALGTVTFAADGSFVYDPRPPNQGVDTFTYRVSDGVSWSAPATVTVTAGKK
jgi:hypothetical protein